MVHTVPSVAFVVIVAPTKLFFDNVPTRRINVSVVPISRCVGIYCLSSYSWVPSIGGTILILQLAIVPLPPVALASKSS